MPRSVARTTSKIPTFANPALRIFRETYVDAVREVYGDDIANRFDASVNSHRFLEHLPNSATESIILTIKKGDIKYISTASAAVPLAAALRQAKEYFETRARPLPKDVTTRLSSHFGPRALNRVRYAVSDDPTTLNGLINWLRTTVFGSPGNNHAVVTDNIIVFAKTPSEHDISFWAHEVMHTIQFWNLGIDRFAHEYVVNNKVIEDEAKAVAAGI